jgi:hypothetical protein
LKQSESEFSTVLVRLKERGWAKFNSGKSYLTTDGLKKVEDLMQKTYAEEESLVLEKIQENGKERGGWFGRN